MTALKEILKALSNVAANRKRMTSYKKAQVEVIIRNCIYILQVIKIIAALKVIIP